MAKAPKGAARPKTAAPSLKMVEFSQASVQDAIAASGATKSGKLLMVPPEGIYVVPGFNLRITDTPEYEAGIAELAESIKSEGFYESQPLGCFPAVVDGSPVFALISGHRRFEAAVRAIAEGAEIDKLPVVLKRANSSDIDLAVSLHKENTGIQPSMMERAVLTHRMLRAGMDETEVAARLNVSARHVNDLKVIIAAPRPVRELIKQNKISASEAVVQLRKDPTGAKILEAAEKAEEKAAAKAAEGKAAAKDSKVTRQTIEGANEPKVKMQVHRMNFQAAEGATFLFEDVEPFLPLLGEDWFKQAKKKAERVALEAVEIEVKIRRPKSEEEAAAETAAPTKPVKTPEVPSVAAKRGKKAPAPEPEAAADESLLEDDEDLGDGTPDLKALGIAEPANAEL